MAEENTDIDFSMPVLEFLAANPYLATIPTEDSWTLYDTCLTLNIVTSSDRVAETQVLR